MHFLIKPQGKAVISCLSCSINFYPTRCQGYFILFLHLKCKKGAKASGKKAGRLCIAGAGRRVIVVGMSFWRGVIPVCEVTRGQPATIAQHQHQQLLVPFLCSTHTRALPRPKVSRLNFQAETETGP